MLCVCVLFLCCVDRGSSVRNHSKTASFFEEFGDVTASTAIRAYTQGIYSKIVILLGTRPAAREPLPHCTCWRPVLHFVRGRWSLHVMAFVRIEWKFIQSVVVWRRFACKGRENPPVDESSRLLLLQTERKLFDDGLKLKIIATFVNFRLFGV